MTNQEIDEKRDPTFTLAVLKHGDRWGMVVHIFDFWQEFRQEIRWIFRAILIIACLILLDPATAGKLRELIIRELLAHLI